MGGLAVTRDIQVPDERRVARARSAPHLGPRILFFSGGSALNGISQQIKRYSFNTIHLITPFDSGGSSQVLREAFDMPAVGDLRSRLMALADETVLGPPDVFRLFSHRLRAGVPAEGLAQEVAQLVSGEHPLLQAVAQPMRQLIHGFLAEFSANVPQDFDYRNASVGNLILAGGYLGNGRALEPVAFLMSKMVDVRGIVRVIVDANLQMGAELQDGRVIISQRLLSGKEVPPITSPIRRIFLSDGTRELSKSDVRLPDRNTGLIRRADVICYPPGSLYSSIVVNLLPDGVGQAIAERMIPKVYLPSLGHDPEALGHDLADQVAAIVAPLQRDTAGQGQATDFITHVLCDDSVPQAQTRAVTERFGVPCCRLPLRQGNDPRYDPEQVAAVLVSLD